MNANAIIDGSYVLHRAMHLQGAMSGMTGVPVGAVESSLKTLMSIIRNNIPPRLFWVHDVAPHPTRLSLCQRYKKKDRTPEQIEEDRKYREAYEAQRNILLSLLPRFGVHVVNGPYESDDSIWYMTDLFSSTGQESMIFTSDRDFIQLLSPRVSVYHLDRDLLVTPANWSAVSEWSPSEIVIAKAILGDRSDGILSPCKGLGKVGLRKLIDIAGSSSLVRLIEEAAKLGGKYATLVDPNAQALVRQNIQLIFLGLVGFETEGERYAVEQEIDRPVTFDCGSALSILTQYGMVDVARSVAGYSHILEVLR